ncbi:MAG TPA: hypothetical protein VFB19_09595 [Mycobacterium sp.]|nr:hypothetical protein [Mycobacterium sp.]
MLSALRRVLDFQMTIAEWIGTAAILAVPYLVIGVVWVLTHLDAPGPNDAFDRVVVMLGSAVLWPALLVSSLCLR